MQYPWGFASPVSLAQITAALVVKGYLPLRSLDASRNQASVSVTRTITSSCAATTQADTREQSAMKGRTRHRSHPKALSVLVRDRLCCVAGQGFEPWKASADGFTVRSHWPLGQPAWWPDVPTAGHDTQSVTRSADRPGE